MAVNHTKTMPPQLRAARVRKQRVIKAIILTFTLLFLLPTEPSTPARPAW